MLRSRLTKYVSHLILIVFSVGIVFAQEDDILAEDDHISNIFAYGMLINTQTTETVPKGSWELRIQHRFGEMDVTRFKDQVIDEFLGFDGSANIRFGFSFALSDRFQIGIGRTKIDKVFDFEGKYKLLRQKETGMPISASLYLNTAIASREFPEVGPNEFFSDLETPFEYEFSHRLTYNLQLLLSKKIGSKVSLELNPTLYHKNLVPPGNDNTVFVTTLGGRFKTGLTSSIIFEFTKKFNDRNNGYTDPISIGFEIGTAGHAFQMFVSTSNQIIEQGIFFSDTLDYTEGKILLGFNIKRTFWNGNN